MNRTVLVAFLLVCSTLQARALDTAGYFNAQSHKGSAVDAKGIRHNGAQYKGAPPWLTDRISGPSPDYPRPESAMRHQGRVIVRLTLDLNTGRVIKTSLLKSSGYPVLDRCAVAAFNRWTWRPGRWKEIDLNTIFEIADPSQTPVPGATRLPRS
jgi:TonB family protein